MSDQNETVPIKMYTCVALVIFFNKYVVFPWVFQGSLSIGKVESGVSQFQKDSDIGPPML